MAIQCELCSADAKTADELIGHYSSHFASGSCQQCHKRLILIDGQCYVLQLHNESNCKHRFLLEAFVLNEFSDFGVIKTEIPIDVEPDETANHSEEPKCTPFELIECHEMKIELDDRQCGAPERTGPSSDRFTKSISAVAGAIEAFPEATIQETLNEASGNTKRRHHCDICGRHYSSKSTLNRHRKVHPKIMDDRSNQTEVVELPCNQELVLSSGDMNPGKYRCSMCPKYLPSESLLRGHMRVVHRRKTIKITSLAELDKFPPEQVHTDSLGNKHLREFCCDYCGKYFMEFRSLRGHLNNYHLPTEQNVSLTEEECKQYPPEQILIKPNGERRLKKFQCNICNKYIASSTSLREHKKTHDEIANSAITHDEIDEFSPDQVSVSSTGVIYSRKLKCSECNRYYLTKQMLQAHMRYHKRATTAKVLTEEECKNLPANRIITLRGQKLLREVKCEHCDRYMLTKKSLKKHIREVHEQKKKRSETPQILTEEESKQYPAGQVFLSCSGVRYLRKYQCDICKGYMLTRRAAVVHMWSWHTRKKVANHDEKHPCDICGKVFTTVSRLRTHKRTHSKTRRFICSYCGKGFDNSELMVQHTNVHTGQKPFKCVECVKTFTTRKYLTVHQRVHTGSKPFKCRVEGCDRAYTHGSQLIRHLCLAHQIYKRKYECHICPRIFYDRPLLTKHMRSHAGVA